MSLSKFLAGRWVTEFGNSANRFEVSRRCRRRFSRRKGHHKSVTTRFEVCLFSCRIPGTRSGFPRLSLNSGGFSTGVGGI